MRPSSTRAPLSPARARNCALLNQFATPGLGSLLARRWGAGAGQLAVFVVGFVFFVVWFVDEMRQYYNLMFSDNEPHVSPWPLWAGLAFCAAGWLWSLVTSISLVREAKRKEREATLAPPRLQP